MGHLAYGQGPMPEPMKTREDCPQAVTRILLVRREAEKPSNPFIPDNRRFRQRPEERRKRKKSRRRNMEREDEYTNLRLTGKGHPHGGPLKDEKSISNTFIFSLQGFRLLAMAIPLQATGNLNTAA